MTDSEIQIVDEWEEDFRKSTEVKEERELPTKEEFIMNLSCPQWDEIKDVVDRAANAFAFDGFDPLKTARLIASMATGGKKQIAALVVLALEVGSLTSGPKVISKGAAESLISNFAILKSAPGNSNAITLPRVVLSFPGYAFQILKNKKVSPKVTIPGWPKELSFPGSINALTSEAQDLLMDAYNMWSVVFGLTISQGTRNNKNKRIVEELSKVLSGEAVSELTWSETMQFSRIACKTSVLRGSDRYNVCNQLVEYSEDLAKCVLAARMRCIIHPSLDLPPDDVQKARDKIFTCLNKKFNPSQ